MLTFYDFLKKRLGSYVSTGYKIYKTVTNNNKKEKKIRRIDYLVFFLLLFFFKASVFFHTYGIGEGYFSMYTCKYAGKTKSHFILFFFFKSLQLKMKMQTGI